MANQHTKRKGLTEQEAADLDRLAAAKPDPHFGHLVTGPTNAELAEKEAELAALREKLGIARVKVGMEKQEKDELAYADLDLDPEGLLSPMQNLANAHKRPGFELKLLGERHLSHLGKRGYQIVKQENGDPVRFGTMVLGEIPTRIAQKIRQIPIERANEQIRAVNNSQREAIDQLRAQANGMGLSLIDPGETMNDPKSGRDVQMGVSIERIVSQ